MWENTEKTVEIPTVVTASTCRCDMCGAVIERRVTHGGIDDDEDFKRMFVPYYEVAVKLDRYTEPSYKYDRKPTREDVYVTVCDQCAQKILEFIGKKDAKDAD